jgi:hypothetical protein
MSTCGSILRAHYQIRVAVNGPKALKIAQSDPPRH